jgi:hypothetical protein
MLLSAVHHLIRKPLQPQGSRQEDARYHLLVDLKANNVRRMVGSHGMSECAFDMVPRAGAGRLVMLRDADHSLTD